MLPVPLCAAADAVAPAVVAGGGAVASASAAVVVGGGGSLLPAGSAVSMGWSEVTTWADTVLMLIESGPTSTNM